VRLLEALKILKDATLDSKKRDIDTPEVRQALALLDPICQPKWTVPGFSHQLRRHAGQAGHQLEGQQQNLRVYFGGIYTCVRQLREARINKLNYRYMENQGSVENQGSGFYFSTILRSTRITSLINRPVK
jgi:hypothetical protein